MMSNETRQTVIQKFRSGERLTMIEEELIVKEAMKVTRANNYTQEEVNAYLKREFGASIPLNYRNRTLYLDL